ncbi:MAG TPA: GNAT family N-acetyltransferase [Roseiflexaceae bacterium]|nr:GNAT family N-acetyltransferase [Roseiflexaceae bacterium]
MAHLRTLRWPADREALRSLDISFTTERIYEVRASDVAFTLVETPVAPPRHKAYGDASEIDSLSTCDYVVVAEIDEILVGVAALRVEEWNRRAALRHIYVDAAYRGHGIGRTLIEDVVRVGRERQARCLWLDTQNINYPAIQFYLRLGFQLCGLDTTFYDSQESLAGEVAIFFAYQL